MSDFKIRGLRPRIQDAEFAFSGLPRVGLVRVFSSLAWLVLWLRRVRCLGGMLVRAWGSLGAGCGQAALWDDPSKSRILSSTTLGVSPFCRKAST
jgi:hypothetical protein